MAARRDVYIVGVGQVGYGVVEDKRLEQIIFEACGRALSDAKIGRDEIETVVMGAQDKIGILQIHKRRERKSLGRTKKKTSVQIVCGSSFCYKFTFSRIFLRTSTVTIDLVFSNPACVSLEKLWLLR